jgi:hypothetical protein
MSDFIYLTLHVRIVQPPKISSDLLYGWLAQIYQAIGIQARLGTIEQLDIPEFYDVDAGSCPLDGSVSPQLAALHSHRDGMTSMEPAIYFVRSMPRYHACASHAKNVPACVISQEVWPLTMAHEVGHVLGLRHTDDNHNLMYAYGVQNTSPPTVLTDEQRAIIRQSPYVRFDTPEIASLRALLHSDLPDNEILSNLTPDSHSSLKALAESTDPVTASKAIHAAGLLRLPAGVRLAQEKIKDARFAVRHAAAAVLNMDSHRSHSKQPLRKSSAKASSKRLKRKQK